MPRTRTIRHGGSMSLTKRYLKTKPVCKVTFRLPRERAE
jgi:hypothetical protein